MRATAEDFRKVVIVAREQISGSLAASPAVMDDYRKGLKTYHEISEGRKEEAKTRGEKEGRAIRHLRDSITPEIKELIQQQRFNVMAAGAKFGKFRRDGAGASGGNKEQRGKHVFLRLSANHKALLYGDESLADSPQQLTKLPVADIKHFEAGPSALGGSAAKDGQRRNKGSLSEALSICIYKETGDSLDLTAPDPKTFDHFCDGLNALLGREMSSGKFNEDKEMFLAMEVKIRLLDLEGIDIPDEAPPIPPPPPNFEFSLQ